MCVMACDDDSYVLDSDGNRVLIGLTLNETREFERLDELISPLSSSPSDGLSLNERRWLVLYDKHDAAVRKYLSSQNAKALGASREE
jgi:hypothetical protein